MSSAVIRRLYSPNCARSVLFFFFASRRRHTRFDCDWSSDVCSSDLYRGMHFDEERLYLLLDRYLAGEASASDAQAVRDWLAEHPDHPLFLDGLRLIRRVATERIPESSVDAAWANAQRALEVPRQPRRSRRLLSVALAAAAVVVALIGGRGVLRRTPQWRQDRTPPAQRLVRRPEDQTQGTPAPNSRLRSAAVHGGGGPYVVL